MRTSQFHVPCACLHILCAFPISVQLALLGIASRPFRWQSTSGIVGNASVHLVLVLRPFVHVVANLGVASRDCQPSRFLRRALAGSDRHPSKHSAYVTTRQRQEAKLASS